MSCGAVTEIAASAAVGDCSDVRASTVAERAAVRALTGAGHARLLRVTELPQTPQFAEIAIQIDAAVATRALGRAHKPRRASSL